MNALISELERFIIWLCDGFTYTLIAMLIVAIVGFPLMLLGIIPLDH